MSGGSVGSGSSRPRQRSKARTLLVLAPDLPRPAIRARLAAAAHRHGMAVVTAGPADPLTTIDDALVAACAQTVLVCGDGATQAAAACVAGPRDRAFACLPSSAADTLARDIDAAAPSRDTDEGGAHERQLDLGEVNGMSFVNYVAIGLSVKPTPAGARVSRAHARDRHAEGVLQRSWPGAPELGRSVLVTNNRFRTLPGGIGSRDRLDGGRLTLLAWDDPAWSGDGAAGWCSAYESSKLELSVTGSVLADVDGVARVLHAPLRLRSVAAAVRLEVHNAFWALRGQLTWSLSDA